MKNNVYRVSLINAQGVCFDYAEYLSLATAKKWAQGHKGEYYASIRVNYNDDPIIYTPRK